MHDNVTQQNPSDTEAGRRLGDALVAAQAKYPKMSLGTILLDVEDVIWDGIDGVEAHKYASLHLIPDTVLIQAVHEYARG